MPTHTTLQAALAAALIAALAACGGSSGGGTADTTPDETPSTPMSTLVVPEAMTWVTAAEAAINITVLNADGTPATGAAVSISTQSTASPHDAQPLRHAVAMELIDAGVTEATGTARFDTRLPAHLSTVLVVATLGDQTGRASVDRTDLSRPLSIQMRR